MAIAKRPPRHISLFKIVSAQQPYEITENKRTFGVFDLLMIIFGERGFLSIFKELV